jgi:hypothetical protein
MERPSMGFLEVYGLNKAKRSIEIKKAVAWYIIFFCNKCGL